MLAWRGAIGLGFVIALGACDDEATRPAPASVDVDLRTCFGDHGGADSTCRTDLNGLVGEGVNGCFIIRRTDRSFYIPVSWTNGALEASQAAPLDVTPGDDIDAALFLFSSFDAGQCAAGGLEVGSACDGACVVKLLQSGVTIGEGTRITFSAAGGSCNIERAEGGLVETCDGMDNDCDGVADNGFDLTQGGAPMPCTVGVGACARGGQMICTADGMGTECNAQAGQPVAEICDGLDNDCDERLDEGIPVDDCCEIDTMRACGVVRGICSTGTQTCVGEGAKGQFGPCVDGAGGVVVEPGERMEICNGLDDDCDGNADEDVVLADGDQTVDGAQPVAKDGECVALDGECAARGRVECDANNQPVCVFTPVMRGAEVCDNGDNDCDGLIDETFAGQGLGDACEVGRGACLQVGRIECADQNTVACNAVEGMPGDELCDNDVDDDCDGVTDEGFDQLGDACTNGIGVCRTNGALVCSANGAALICNAEAGQGGAELCDQLDNDCDGRADEDFDTTDDPENCGACGRDCGPIVVNGVAGCAASECTVVACLEGFDDQDRNPLNGCECNPESPDLPDPDFTDTNCDGLDGDAARAIFVSVDLGDDGNTGGQDDPFATLAHAIGAAGILGRDIYLDAGTYDVTQFDPAIDPNLDRAELARVGLRVPAGVSIYGGYRYNANGHTWIRGDRGQVTTVITGAQRVLRFEGAQGANPVFLDNLEVVTGEAVDHPYPTVGVAAINTGGSLVLRNVLILAGAGADGPDGPDGLDATALGGAGTQGVAGDSLDRAGFGGTGGPNPSCQRQSGGAGGNGRQGAQVAQAGAEGSTDPILNGGQPGGGGPPGDDGQDGRPGGHGANTDGGTFVGRIDQVSLLWIPRPTGNALTGTPGGGGGGGGGGAINNSGGGGGGGAGGCAGSGGRGAQGGAMSIGLYVLGGTVHLRNVDITSGRGGDGGRGGHGGLREEGSGGGLGGSGSNGNPDGNGGRGGRGGDGGCGGHAGGGGAGSSFAIFRANASNIEADLANSQVVFEDRDGRRLNDQQAAAAQALTAGAAGEAGPGGGGDRSEICGEQAATGDDGTTGLIGCCPFGPGINNCRRLTCE